MTYYILKDNGKRNKKTSIDEVVQFYSIITDALVEGISSPITGALEAELQDYILSLYSLVMKEQTRAYHAVSRKQDIGVLQEFFEKQDTMLKEMISELADQREWGKEVLKKADTIRYRTLLSRLEVDVAKLKKTKFKR